LPVDREAPDQSGGLEADRASGRRQTLAPRAGR